jgi:nicotinamidase/pyrazinamidase
MSNSVESASLIIVDLQNDFCSEGALPVPGGEKIVPVVNRLMTVFTSVVATQDWHPPGHISFSSSHAGKNPFDSVLIQGAEQLLWPDHCLKGTEGAAFHPDLDMDNLHLILRKGFRRDLDSYSGFYENDRKTPTGLSQYLRELGVRSAWLCGLASDVCVFYTAMDAVKLGFETYVIEDAVRGVDVPAGNISRTSGAMKAAGVRFVHSTKVKPKQV